MQCYLITGFVVCERVWFGYCFASCGFCGFVKVGCLRVGLWGLRLYFGCFGFSCSVYFADWFAFVN